MALPSSSLSASKVVEKIPLARCLTEFDGLCACIASEMRRMQRRNSRKFRSAVSRRIGFEKLTSSLAA